MEFCSVLHASLDGKGREAYGRMDICICMIESFTLLLRLPLHFQSAIPQYKIKSLKFGFKKCGMYTPWTITQPLKKNETMPFAAIWIDLETTILSEVGQTNI